jgi:hypothetical protein
LGQWEASIRRKKNDIGMRSLLLKLGAPARFNLTIAMRAALKRARAKPRVLPSDGDAPVDIFLCLVDHYEPQLGRPERSLAQARVQDWERRYPEIADRHRDADGCLPKHSFFYPYDEYDAWELDHIAELCRAGYGEVEIHLHHRDDTEETLREKLREAVRLFRSHGLLSCWPDGRPAWGFIHGNWALANSRCDANRNYCGVNNEIAILQEEGCYADFTFPAWQHTAQPRQMNSVYYALSDAARPKSYDTGQVSRSGVTQEPGLLLIQGPLVPFLDRKGKKIRFAMDDADLASYRRYHPSRLDRWVNAGISVQGRPDRLFIKLHSHGAADQNREAMLGTDLEALFADAEARYNDGKRYRLHYVTAREMFNVVKATEAGIEDIQTARNWVIPPQQGYRKTT